MAIQEAVIQNIKKLQPDADIRLISLQPAKVSRLHSVPSFSITSLSLPYYSEGISCRKGRNNETDKAAVKVEQAEKRLLTAIKFNLREYPRLFSTLKRAVEATLGVLRLPGLVCGETSHFVEACRVMKGAKVLLVSGGGQIDDYWGGPWGHPYSLFKWSIIAKVIGAKYALLGVGTGSLESKLSKLFIHLALNRAAYRSFRDEESKRLLEKISSVHNDTICPDLAWSLKKDRSSPSNCDRKLAQKVVGLNLMAHMRRNMPKYDPSKYEEYLKNMAALIKGLHRCGYLVILFLTDSPDRHVFEEISYNFQVKDLLSAHAGISQGRTESLSELFTILSQIDYVVASRLHAVILSHLAKKPVIAISYDRKVSTYMREAGFQDYCFDIDKLNIEFLMKSFEDMVCQASKIEARLEQLAIDYTKMLGSQYKSVLELE